MSGSKCDAEKKDKEARTLVDFPGPGLLIDELARMPEKAVLDATRLAAILRVETRTLRRMVSRGELPPSVPFSGHSVWLAGRVLAHLEAAAEREEKEAEKQLQKIRRLSP